mgnify:CR=1 FL=1
MGDAPGVTEAGDVEEAQGKAEDSGQGRAHAESLEERSEPILRFRVVFEREAVENASVEAIEVARGRLLVALEGKRPAQRSEERRGGKECRCRWRPYR